MTAHLLPTLMGKLMHNQLGDKRHVTLILRLAIDKDGRLARGELINLSGVVMGRFIEWPKLTQMIQAWITDLTNHGVDQANNKPDIPNIKN